MTDLISRAKKGDPEAFITLMENSKSDMYRVAISILNNDADAADAMSETILKCWCEIGKLKKEKYFKTWLTRILINNCNDIIRKNSRTVYVESYEAIEPSEASFEYSTKRNVSECIDSLSENNRLIMTLYYTQGFKAKEIADMLNLNINTVKTRLSRARNEFKDIYEEVVSL